MSAYCKFSQDDSDLFLYGGVEGRPPDEVHVIVCCMCLLHEEQGWGSFGFAAKEELSVHLEEHVKAGHVIPAEAITKIAEDDWIS